MNAPKNTDLKVLKQAVARLVIAHVNFSWKGSQEASAVADYEAELETAKSAYKRALRLLEQKLNKEQP